MVPARTPSPPTSHPSTLCKPCWFALPHATGRLLWLSDDQARRRLLRLLEAIHRGCPLASITPDILNAPRREP